MMPAEMLFVHQPEAYVGVLPTMRTVVWSSAGSATAMAQYLEMFLETEPEEDVKVIQTVRPLGAYQLGEESCQKEGGRNSKRLVLTRMQLKQKRSWCRFH
mmetsp:Transcript_2355/g.3649  ORF Transcript_2355/g.3649 Transcript_2355/m.3649 type:complete len:100 (-) Transcript_2355:98-397(-)